ncbi:cellulase family glycosylhydrolase [Candidatus Uhrbacteria bacterium]|nr:cellulase family glycosylhydrolase [Candidatus Uhrbacteria bacterium]
MAKVIRRLRIVLFAILFLFLFLLGFLNLPAMSADEPRSYGVTFSPWQARTLGLDWKETYQALLDDLGVRNFRISAYWNDGEPQDGTYAFDDFDYQLEEAQKRSARVLFAVGRKLPRWPECHDPAWIRGASRDRYEKELFEYLKAILDRYKDNDAIWAWQVENELFFPFGICPNKQTAKVLQKEIELVRSYSSKPIVITDAGEWSVWIPAASYGDILGASLYRESWNSYLGYIPFPIQPGYYQARAWIIKKLFGSSAIITELQVEPWGPKPVQEMTAEEGLRYMPVEKIKNNIAFAKRVGFSDAYLWGAEWWYWMKKQGDDRVWEILREVYLP